MSIGKSSVQSVLFGICANTLSDTRFRCSQPVCDALIDFVVIFEVEQIVVLEFRPIDVYATRPTLEKKREQQRDNQKRAHEASDTCIGLEYEMVDLSDVHRSGFLHAALYTPKP